MTNDQEPGVSNDAAETPDDREAVVLDYLARGDSDADRRRLRDSPVAYAVAPEDFALYGVALTEDANVSIGDRIVVEGETSAAVQSAHRVGYDDLSGGAQSELSYVVEEIVEADEQRFVDFYNDSQPISLRLHQLNLIPGIGEKLQRGILDERKRQPFDSFADIADRVNGLHDPKGVIVDRIMEELQETDLKYRNFVATPPAETN